MLCDRAFAGGVGRWTGEAIAPRMMVNRLKQDPKFSTCKVSANRSINLAIHNKVNQNLAVDDGMEACRREYLAHDSDLVVRQHLTCP